MIKMASSRSGRSRYVVCRDFPTVRKILGRIRRSQQLAPLCLSGRRRPERLRNLIEHCSGGRRPVRMPLHVTPASFDGREVKPLDSQPYATPALTRDVSLRGVGFAHQTPLEGDHAIVTLDLSDGEPVSLLLELRWSNRLDGSCCTSGGRFVGVVQTR